MRNALRPTDDRPSGPILGEPREIRSDSISRSRQGLPDRAALGASPRSVKEHVSSCMTLLSLMSHHS